MHDAPLTNGVHLNGAHDTKLATLDAHDAADSPAIDSPATPVNDSPTPTVKIDVQYDDHLDGDVKHETVDMKVDIEEDASTAQAATPADTAAVDKASPPPSSQDVPMSEEPQSADVDMAEADAPAPSHGSTAASSSVPGAAAVDPLATSSPYSTTSPNDDDIQPPPAKRARKHSDADQASLANTATPPPGSASPAPANDGEREASKNRGPPTLSSTQHRFCLSTIRTLRKLKAAIPFLQPVDPIALNVPTYPDVIKHPMDFSTIERKLHSSSPSKPDPNPSNPRYLHADEFVADVRLVFSNCVRFNGPDHVVTQMCKQVEEVFDRQMKNFPPAEPVKPPAPKKVATPPPPPPPVKKPAARRPSNAMPVIRRAEENGRPKREIHPPPPKDLPYAEVPKKMRKAKLPKDSGVAEQLRFCDKILKDLHKKIHYNIAHPFYEPVDWVALDIPSYPKIIKKPMDLATMRKKLDNGDYPTADAFHNDFKLMMRNCMTFNPVGTPVNTAGQELQRLFDEKWKNLPQPRASVESDDEEEEDENSEDDAHARIVADMEARIAEMHQALAELKRSKSDVKKKEKKKERHVPQPVASTSKPPPKANGKPPVNRKKNTKRPISDDDVLSFEQKKELSDTIGKLDGSKLERVIQIIHEGVPEIRDSTEEIELEIDTLPAAVLTKLYNFVIRPNRAPPAKRARTGKGTGTGGLKRKSMDEDVEAEKIRVLEERMALFEKGGPVASVSHTSAPTAGHDSDHSSDSSSDDSSGSDSE